jgi:hypothetical protein
MALIRIQLSLGSSSSFFVDVFKEERTSHSSLEFARQTKTGNYLLSQRFGSRERRYLSHLPKVLNIHIMREVSEIWKEEIFLVSLHMYTRAYIYAPV